MATSVTYDRRVDNVDEMIVKENNESDCELHYLFHPRSIRWWWFLAQIWLGDARFESFLRFCLVSFRAFINCCHSVKYVFTSNRIHRSPFTEKSNLLAFPESTSSNHGLGSSSFPYVPYPLILVRSPIGMMTSRSAHCNGSGGNLNAIVNETSNY